MDQTLIYPFNCEKGCLDSGSPFFVGDIGRMEWWNGGMVEWWNDGMMDGMEWWNGGSVDCWNDGTLECWNDGMMG